MPKRALPKSAPVAAAKSQIVAFLDRMDGAEVDGWAVDAEAPREPLKLRVLIDGLVVDLITCELRRNDVASLKLPSDRIGFHYSISPLYQDGGRHVLQFATIDGTNISFATRTGMTMPELHFSLARQTTIIGVMDGLVDGLIQGWALRVDQRTKVRTGSVRILVAVGAQPIAELIADQFRADVAETMSGDAANGFAFSAPPELRHGRRLVLSFFAMPERVELQGSPVEVMFAGDAERARINALIARADELFSYAYHLRRELKAALPGERFMLSDYARWAFKSRKGLRPRAIARYGELPARRPLISIVCPVYRPVIGEFLMAMDSIRQQSYENWELLLVDDASRNQVLTDAIKQFAKTEPRFKGFSLRENGGISEATNYAISQAKGEFIAFFDHDDKLEPEALEIMLRAQTATGARVLYSDEDKIDRSGAYSEPHFKPDFNYRFLLDLNYICHFVMVDAALIKEVGELNSLYDGAQDHDFLLRIAERIPPEQIHHVSEILYHWRKSERSTAGSGAAKPTAAIAGQRAVAAHLGRRKLNADVIRRGGLTCYQIVWNPAATAKKQAGASILIPFRDHIDLTRACVEAIRKVTKDVNYEIILLDNWSTGAAAEAFCAEQANLPRTCVIEIPEAFNYSRINNIGAERAQHDFVLFLNNDVFVKDPSWLRNMLNECLVNDRVGAVGAKLLYQNGTVQHAGVVLGVGGIADHAFRGLAGDSPGYVMRAMAAQQISAVTAACMLVRKSAFDQVGGFDANELTVAFNDVDLCIKLADAGWQIIFNPDIVAEHRESMSRGDDLNESKVARFMLENEVMRQRHANTLPYDPFYNQHFSREGGVYRELRLLEAGELGSAAGQPPGGKDEEPPVLRRAGAVETHQR